MAFLFIALAPATKSLPDGRNAHLIVRGAGWWRKHLRKFFTEVSANEENLHLIYFGTPKT
jgi:hypothetical protein